MISRLLAALFALLLAGSLSAHGATLSESEAAELKAQGQVVFDATARWDFSIVLDKTHPSLYTIAPRPQMEEMMKVAAQKMKNANMKFDHLKLGEPGELHTAGDEELCFLPTEMHMSFSGKKVEMIGFLVAIRSAGGKEWKFLSSTVTKKNQELLWTLFPKLPKEVELPPRSTRVVE